MSFSRPKEGHVYVGNLPPDVRTKDIEDLFYKYGRTSNIDLKENQRGPPFAFVEFDDPRDAEDAVRYRDGYDFDGYTLRVEFPRGGQRGGGQFRRGGFGDRGGGYGGGRDGGGFGGGGRGRGPPSRRSEYRVRVTGLPNSGSWQDLKDHMREAGDVCYADVFKDGSGVVEYMRQDDMKYALRKLDDTRFKSHEGDTSYVRVKAEDSRGGGGRSASRSRSRSRSRTPAARHSPRGRSRSQT